MRRLLGIYTALLLGVLYAPIAVMILFSFNTSKYFRWSGFTLDWYRRAWENRDLRSALAHTLLLALACTILSTVLGTMAALALRRPFRGRRLLTALVVLPVMMPDVVLGAALLSLYRALGMGLSLATAAAAHATFGLSYVTLVVSARLQALDASAELAARDLGATPWGAFWRVTFPALRTAILSGALLAFTLSFDDFAVTYFTAGPGGATLPVMVYSMVRFGVTPEINAVSTVLLLASLGLLAASLRLSRVPLLGGGR